LGDTSLKKSHNGAEVAIVSPLDIVPKKEPRCGSFLGTTSCELATACVLQGLINETRGAWPPLDHTAPTVPNYKP
jgi:hypothetical protein